MSYVLDGIKTAMELRSYGEITMAVCPCGWESQRWQSWQDRVGSELSASMRFHYAHCPKAGGLPSSGALLRELTAREPTYETGTGDVECVYCGSEYNFEAHRHGPGCPWWLAVLEVGG